MSSAALTRLSNLNTRFLSVISLFHFSEFSNSLEVLSRETWANQMPLWVVDVTFQPIGERNVGESGSLVIRDKMQDGAN